MANLKTKIIDIQPLPVGGAVLTVDDETTQPFEVNAEYMALNPIVGGYYTAVDGVEGFEL